MDEKQIHLLPRAIIILCGPAASGKDSLKDTFIKRGFKHAVSYTTRPPRKNEIHGRDYYFLTVEEFQDKESQGYWYEFVKFNGWYYGTSKEQMVKCDTFIMTPSGISKLKPEDRKNAFIIYMDIPEEIRRQRLEKRVIPGDSLERRMQADKKDFDNFKDFDIRIKSSELSDFM
jgi:guanylate kinase